MTTSSSAQFVEQPHWSSGIPAQGSPASSTQNQQYAPPIIQQQSQYQTTIPASSSLAPPNLGTTTPSQPGSPAAAGGGSLQGGITKIQQQLNTHGGKYGALLGKELQKQADALKSVPIVADINAGGPPTLYSVFKAGGAFSKDDVVTSGGDRNHVLYYLEFPRTWSNSWNLTLRHQGNQGPVVCTLQKGSYGFTAHDVEITMASGWKTVLAKSSFVSKAHEFVGFDGTRFKWKGDGMLSSNMLCIDLSNGHVAATWEHSFSYGKDGKLLVNPIYNPILDLIVATALAMEEWRREEAEKGGGGTKSTLGAGMDLFKKFKK